MLVFRLVFEGLETFTNRLFGQRTDPQTLHGALTACLLIDPALDEFAFLTGITAVDDFVGLRDEFFEDVELLVYPFVAMHFDGEARRNHRQRTEAPSLPLLRIFLRVK